MKGHLIATAVAFGLFGLIALNHTRIEYAFDEWINVLEPSCTYEQYSIDKLSCVKESYR